MPLSVTPLSTIVIQFLTLSLRYSIFHSNFNHSITLRSLNQCIPRVLNFTFTFFYFLILIFHSPLCITNSFPPSLTVTQGMTDWLILFFLLFSVLFRCSLPPFFTFSLTFALTHSVHFSQTRIFLSIHLLPFHLLTLLLWPRALTSILKVLTQKSWNLLWIIYYSVFLSSSSSPFP